MTPATRRTRRARPTAPGPVRPALWALLLAAMVSPHATAQTAATPPAAASVAASVADAAADAADTAEAAETATESDRPRKRARAPARPVWRSGIDDFLLETGALPDAPEARAFSTLRASAFVSWQPSRAWEWRAGARVDGQAQTGGSVDLSRWRADLSDTYLRWRGGDTRLSFGAQTIVWGRVDAVPLIDRVSRVDLTRFVLDDLPERRRAQLALRWEENWDAVKLDAVLLPAFRGAVLPAMDSVWSPLDRRRGRALGLPDTPALQMLVRNARIGREDGGSGGGALRLTHTGEPFDMGLTLARTRQPLPYFSADPVAGRLTAVHPFVNFAGIDGEWVAGDLTWRFEIGLSSDVPVTLAGAAMGRMGRATAREAVVALEFFPGGKDTRVNLQLALRSLRADAPFLEVARYAGVNGEIESTFAQGRWKAGLRFASGLNVHDSYLAPRIAFVGWEPHEIYLAGHWFKGETQSLGGFHRDHGFVALGLKTRF